MLAQASRHTGRCYPAARHSQSKHIALSRAVLRPEQALLKGATIDYTQTPEQKTFPCLASGSVGIAMGGREKPEQDAFQQVSKPDGAQCAGA